MANPNKRLPNPGESSPWMPRITDGTNQVVSPTPPTPSNPNNTVVPSSGIKTADPDVILFDDETLPIEYMTDLIFEDIGGQELISIARNDTVNGQNVVYQPIRNLSKIQQQYNPNNIIALQATSDKYFAGFAVKFDNKVPEVGNGPDGGHVYIDPQTGNLIVEAINLSSDEIIEIQVSTAGTIYTADLS